MFKALVLTVALLATGCGRSPQALTGPAGPAGAQGEKGDQGPTGPKGDPGAPGADGQDAEIETIALCPSLGGGIGFQEYALRIGGQLYAVYAQGQKIFLTRLSPGAYVTTDGRSCAFTVTAAYEVTY